MVALVETSRISSNSFLDQPLSGYIELLKIFTYILTLTIPKQRSRKQVFKHIVFLAYFSFQCEKPHFCNAFDFLISDPEPKIRI